MAKKCKTVTSRSRATARGIQSPTARATKPQLKSKETTAILFARVLPKHKLFVKKQALKEGVSEAAFVNHMIEWYKDSSKPKKSK